MRVNMFRTVSTLAHFPRGVGEIDVPSSRGEVGGGAAEGLARGGGVLLNSVQGCRASDAAEISDPSRQPLPYLPIRSPGFARCG